MWYCLEKMKSEECTGRVNRAVKFPLAVTFQVECSELKHYNKESELVLCEVLKVLEQLIAKNSSLRYFTFLIQRSDVCVFSRSY